MLLHIPLRGTLLQDYPTGFEFIPLLFLVAFDRRLSLTVGKRIQDTFASSMVEYDLLSSRLDDQVAHRLRALPSLRSVDILFGPYLVSSCTSSKVRQTHTLISFCR